jgi:hypothetical protein
MAKREAEQHTYKGFVNHGEKNVLYSDKDEIIYVKYYYIFWNISIKKYTPHKRCWLGWRT